MSAPPAAGPRFGSQSGSARRRSHAASGPLWQQLVAAVTPQTCAVCGDWIADREPICSVCVVRLAEIASKPYCGQCGRSMHPLAMREDCCAECVRERFWNVAGVARVGAYAPELRHLLVGLKYAGHEGNARVLARLMADALRTRPWLTEVQALVPVPMHPFRRLVRPCDHARVLADALGRELHLPVLNACKRAQYGESLTSVTSMTQRFEKVRGCFALRRFRRVRGLTVCIVDNLMATGATVCEVSKVLRRGGAQKIYAVVAARTVLRGQFQAEDDVLPAAEEPRK